MNERVKERTRVLGTGKSRGLYGVLEPCARLQSEGKRIASSWVFRNRWETRLPSPPAPQQEGTPLHTPRPHTHTALPPPDPGLRADASPSSGALCRGSDQCRGDQDTPSPEGRGAGACCSSSNRVRRRRRLPSPLPAHTPYSVLHACFPSSLLSLSRIL